LSLGRASRLALLALLAVWALAPIAALVAHAISTGDRLTGADGVVAGDQLQYLAWARDAGSHGLAGNLFDLTPSVRDYLQPLFTITGALWRVGLPMAAAYWLWKPVAVAVLFAGTAAWAARLAPQDARGRWAIIALGLFLFTPLAAIYGWAALGPPSLHDNLPALAGELFSAGELWGYLPTAIAIGLMPVVLLACERAIGHDRRRGERHCTALAGAAALLIAWLHPWQGVTLILLLAGLGIWSTWAERRVLVWPLLGAAIPLLYYLLLDRLDPAWKLAAHNDVVARLPALALLAGLAPILILAAVGLRRPGRDMIERALLLWVVAVFATYFLVSAFPSHAFEGLSLPLSVLAVRGARRLRLPTIAGVLLVAAVTVPGILYEARAFKRIAASSAQQFYLSPSDARALDWIADEAPPGPVLARTIIAVGVPSQTDRSVWVGHEFWSRDYRIRAALADDVFDGGLTPALTRLVVLRSGVRLVLSDCGARRDPGPAIAPIVRSERRFGCATVYVIRRR